MLNSQLYDPEKVWAFLQELYEVSSKSSDWSFSQLCKKHELPQSYGTVINQETQWLKDKRWAFTLKPKLAFINILINKVKAYHAKSQRNHYERKERVEQQKAFNELVFNIFNATEIFGSERIKQIQNDLIDLCDEFVIFKDSNK